VIIPWYDLPMKTAISLPNDVFESADELAQRLGISRSELYATAVAEYLAELSSKVVERHDQAATFWCVSSRSICAPFLN
jgi:metal-responsive CopG/Arc/MetJ family transcriptional regulator